eukprot:CAMPEP_0116833536 /NCGR_PEP_ID=MMETSP0418-20121206/6490_1 /TAXON_ID=1158023 /ORGANISM="Astrosyne radiata, Strain 13vi08-1A" /LENGTH=423 /DNA_ID=CAMNT_0004462995 /DNA_START=81 /DNA_END=1352 /DNA_ORIENTATION=+
MNLVKFYEQNELAREEDVEYNRTISLPAEEEGVTVLVNETYTQREIVYPLTADTNTDPNQTLTLAEMDALYRQLLMGVFTAQCELAAKYEAARPVFAGILGKTFNANLVTKNIANDIFDRYIGHAITTKGRVDEQDMMYLSNIQSKLGLSAKQGEELALESQKKILVAEFNTLTLLDEEEEENWDDPNYHPMVAKEIQLVDVSHIIAFREKCESMGFDFESVGIPKGDLLTVFEQQVGVGMMEDVFRTAEDVDNFRETLGLEEYEIREILITLIEKQARLQWDNIRYTFISNSTDVAQSLRRLVRFGRLLDGELGLDVSGVTDRNKETLRRMFWLLDQDYDDPRHIQDDARMLEKMMRGEGKRWNKRMKKDSKEYKERLAEEIEMEKNWKIIAYRNTHPPTKLNFDDEEPMITKEDVNLENLF